MNQADLIYAVTTAIVALDRLLSFLEVQGIDLPDFRVRVVARRTRFEALLLRLQSQAEGVPLSSAETAGLEAALSELDTRAAVISRMDDALRILDLASTVASILGPDSFSFALLSGDDPTKSKG
jgi:hypothetical protein